MAKKITVSRRDKVLKTALLLFRQNGLHGVPVSAISEQSGVAVGTIYHHFKSKEELIFALYSDVIDQLGISITKYDDALMPYRDRFQNLWNNLYNWLLNNKSEFNFIEQFANSPFYNDKSIADKNGLGEPLNHFLLHGQHSGQLIEMDLRLMVNLFYAHAATLAKFQLSTPKADKKLVAITEKAIWRALKSKSK